MIPRFHKIIFGILLASCAAMAFYLVYLRSREGRVVTVIDQAPIVAPTIAPEKEIQLVLANDTTGKLSMATESIPLPASANAQARTLLTTLLSDYAKPLSQHPLPSGATVDDVFLLPMRQPTLDANDAGMHADATPVIAVVNLDRNFADNHPSGIEPEMLTIRSIVATLRQNIPNIKQVRFLVDGQQRDTLAGHASLARAYDSSQDSADPVNGSIQ